MQIDSPYKNQEPKQVIDGKAYYYTKARKEQVINYVPININRPQSGVRPVPSTVIVPEDGEIVDLETGESDTKYWQPERVMNPEGCDHVFSITDVGNREIECDKCHFPTTIHLGINFREIQGTPEICINNHWYTIYK